MLRPGAYEIRQGKDMGNILIGVATLIYFGLLGLIYRSHSDSGQVGVGRGWMLILGNFGFVLCLTIVTGIIGSKGGFSWVASDGGLRFVLVLVGFILIMVGTVLVLLGESLRDLPPFVTRVLNFAPAVLPLLVLASAGILLNDGWRSTWPELAFKLPLAIALAFGVFAVGLLLRQGARKAAERIQAESDAQKQIHQNYHDNIDSCDVTKEIISILGYTDANHYPDVREHALAKIKSHPDWQEELLKQIKTDGAPKVYTFLASNEVDDKEIFTEAVREGLLVQAKLIREGIRKAAYPSQLTADEFFWQVQRALRTADKFAGLGTDYRPAVEEIRKALDEPSNIEKPKFRCTALLDDWLKKHG